MTKIVSNNTVTMTHEMAVEILKSINLVLRNGANIDNLIRLQACAQVFSRCADNVEQID